MELLAAAKSPPTVAAAALAASLAVFLALAACSAPRRGADRRPPNIVLFLVDDLGWQDLSEPFGPSRTKWNDRYRTPNVERLCREGMKFSSAYAHCVCTPTRVSILTGANPARHGVTQWTLNMKTPGRRSTRGLSEPEWNWRGLQPAPGGALAWSGPTLPQRLAAVGYRTIHVGKAHFGAIGTPGADPSNLGFAVNIAGHAAGAPSSYLAKKAFLRDPKDRVWQVPGLEAYHGQDRFLTDVLTDEALEAAGRAADGGEPFFLHFAHYAVHAPLDRDDRFARRYLDQGIEPVEANYCALIEGVDDSLGRLLRWLDDRGIADDTVVIFTSDNGGLSAVVRGGERHRHNSPLRSGKGSAYEGGVRVPLAVRWPFVVEPDSVCDLPVLVDDLFPTICEIAGADPSCPDGRSYVPSLRGIPQPTRPLVWHYPNVWGPKGPGIEPYSAIRLGDHKLIWFYEDERAELYDVSRDLGEEHELAEALPGVARRLRAALRRILIERGAKIPLRKSEGAAALP